MLSKLAVYAAMFFVLSGHAAEWRPQRAPAEPKKLEQPGRFHQRPGADGCPVDDCGYEERKPDGKDWRPQPIPSEDTRRFVPGGGETWQPQSFEERGAGLFDPRPPDSRYFDPPWAKPRRIPTEDLPVRAAPPEEWPLKQDRLPRSIVMPPRQSQLDLDKPVPPSPQLRRTRRHAPFDHPFGYPADMDFLRNRAWT